jgi:hypothetical protein
VSSFLAPNLYVSSRTRCAFTYFDTRLATSAAFLNPTHSMPVVWSAWRKLPDFAGAMNLDAPAKLGEADRGGCGWNIVPASGNFPLPAPDPPNANRLQAQSLTSFNLRRFIPATVNHLCLDS